VEAGKIAVSRAAALAGLPKDEQAQAVVGGGKGATLQARPKRASGKPEPGPEFGVVAATLSGSPTGVVFLWVAPNGLEGAVEALQRRGYRYVAG
jgi:hypothetical protein